MAAAQPPVNAGAASKDTAAAVTAFASAEDAAEYRWITREDMDNLAFPNVFLRILNGYFGS
ncbi:NUDIX hydrolase [Paenibacillus phocaensis]|uniref:hypothetical protein n=1 Tax=Paenibacillus phocaensis TaxID=1776378 RepID=UPI000839B433|nr:hypothetical protein [Paenibacillus phocaensis]